MPKIPDLLINVKEKADGIFLYLFLRKIFVSHIPQRKEKDCLNCGTLVQGRYCHVCGQENTVPHETFGHMVKHFLYDITHFDSKFFDSMKLLLLKPGFLPSEYIKGRRASYLNPVKKYVFTSAVFFLIFFGLTGGKKTVNFDLDKPLTKEERLAYIRKGEQKIAADPANTKWAEALLLLKDTARVLVEKDMAMYRDDFNYINAGSRSYTSQEEYDSVQRNLPAGEKDNWFQRLIQEKNLALRKKYRNEPEKGFTAISDSFLHRLPYLLFVSLPLFALILKLLYSRNKKYYYADHAIFSIYHYIFTFILFLVLFGLDKLTGIPGLGFLDFVMAILFLSGGVYLYISMKKFYRQGHGKTFLKFLLLNLSGVIILLLLFAVFILLSVFEI